MIALTIENYTVGCERHDAEGITTGGYPVRGARRVLYHGAPIGLPRLESLLSYACQRAGVPFNWDSLHRWESWEEWDNGRPVRQSYRVLDLRPDGPVQKLLDRLNAATPK